MDPADPEKLPDEGATPAPSSALWFGARAVTWLWLARLVLAWLVSRPLALLLSAGLDDDRVLFEPGALWLTEVLRLRFEQLDDTLGTTFGLLAFAWLVLTVVSAWLCALLYEHGNQAAGAPDEAVPAAERRRTAYARAFGRTLRVAPRLAGLGATWGVVVGAFTIVGGVTLGRLYDGPLSRGTSVVRDGSLLGGLALLALVVAAVSALHDLARARVVAHDDAFGAALAAALGAVRRHFGKLVGARLLLAVAALTLTWASALLTDALAVEQEGALRVGAIALLHQSVAWLLAAGHVLWLWLTLRWTAGPRA